jgi:hypothetical protein
LTDVLSGALPRVPSTLATAPAALRTDDRAVARAVLVDGRAAVGELLPTYDVLARRCGLPITARAAWIRASLDADADASPWAVVVRGEDGELLAAAVLLGPPGGRPGAPGKRTDGRDGAVVLAGGGQGYRAGVAAADAAAARRLGAALAVELARRAPGCPIELGPLPDDERTGWVAGALGADVVASDPVPWVRTDRGGELGEYLSHGLRKTLRKSRNRMAADGLTPRFHFTGSADEVVGLLPAMEDAYRGRDREHGLPCLLDTPAGLRLWRGRILRLLDAGCLEVATLTVDDELASYVLGVQDGNRYGVMEGRFVTALARYAPGRLLEAAVLERVAQDERYVGLDWMTGVAPETLLAANDADFAVVLRRPAAATTPSSN